MSLSEQKEASDDESIQCRPISDAPHGTQKEILPKYPLDKINNCWGEGVKENYRYSCETYGDELSRTSRTRVSYPKEHFKVVVKLSGQELFTPAVLRAVHNDLEMFILKTSNRGRVKHVAPEDRDWFKLTVLGREQDTDRSRQHDKYLALLQNGIVSIMARSN